MPYVDFNELGMYDHNQDAGGAEADYVPVTLGHLDGSVSLQPVFRDLYERNRTIAGNVPLILFIDWPCEMMSKYNALLGSEKEDYWKIYAAEAYANGLFMAFHLRTSISTDPTAASQGMLGFFKEYQGFYRDNASFFHHNQLTELSVTLPDRNINSSVMWQPEEARYTIHLVNHNYTTRKGMDEKKRVYGFTEIA